MIGSYRRICKILAPIMSEESQVQGVNSLEHVNEAARLAVVNAMDIHSSASEEVSSDS